MGSFYRHKSSEYRSKKWDKYKEYYQTLPENKKFNLYSIDQIADTSLLKKFLSEKLPDRFSKGIPTGNEAFISWAGANLPELLKTNSYSKKDSLFLANIAFDCTIPADSSAYRDLFLYRNFYRLYEELHWKNEKVYGAFGLGHTLQGFKGTFAEMVKRGQLFENKFVSLTPLYVNSHISILSKGLPSILADKGEFTRLSYGFDNIWLYYIRGIEDFKRLSTTKSINIFKLTGNNSPYLHSGRGLKSFSLLPLIPKIPIDPDKSITDYTQYIIFVNGSDWIRPDE